MPFFLNSTIDASVSNSDTMQEVMALHFEKNKHKYEYILADKNRILNHLKNQKDITNY